MDLGYCENRAPKKHNTSKQKALHIASAGYSTFVRSDLSARIRMCGGDRPMAVTASLADLVVPHSLRQSACNFELQLVVDIPSQRLDSLTLAEEPASPSGTRQNGPRIRDSRYSRRSCHSNLHFQKVERVQHGTLAIGRHTLVWDTSKTRDRR